MFGRGRESSGRGGRDGVRGRASGRSTPGYISMKLMEKDPGADQPIWYGGAASAFVIAAKFMETRAKDEGVWEFWDGTEDSTSYITAPEIEIKYDARFSSELYDSTSTDGIALTITLTISTTWVLLPSSSTLLDGMLQGAILSTILEKKRESQLVVFCTRGWCRRPAM
jgi:hypothetical protein